MLGACFQGGNRRRAFRDQDTVLLVEPLALGAAAEIEVGSPAPEDAIDGDLLEHVQTSLCQTRATLHWDEGPVDREDRARIVRASYTDLSDYADGTAVACASGLPPIDSTASQSTCPHQDTACGCDPECCQEEALPVDNNPDIVGAGSMPEEEDSQENCATASGRSKGRPLDRVETMAVRFLRSEGLRPREVGSRNYSKWRGRTLWNQCFYMSIACAYLGHKSTARHVRGLALRLRRTIEAVVLEKHPSWAAGLKASTEGRGQAMVFADFLATAMRCDDVPWDRNLLAKLVVCVLDSVGGHVEAYIGPGYDKLEDPAEQERNLILLWYKPGHYQCLVRDDEHGSKPEMSYAQFKSMLVKNGVAFIETFE